jgi:hypothetical protein
MADYTAFMLEESYPRKRTGAQLVVSIMNAANPAERAVSATTGLNRNESFEVVAVEEVGNDGVDEQVQGRHSGSFSCSAYFSAEQNDKLPTRQDFKGKEYLVLVQIAEGWPGAGNVLDAYVGCVLSEEGSQMAPRGAATVNLSFSYTRRYNGKEWAALGGP